MQAGTNLPPRSLCHFGSQTALLTKEIQKKIPNQIATPTLFLSLFQKMTSKAMGQGQILWGRNCRIQLLYQFVLQDISAYQQILQIQCNHRRNPPYTQTEAVAFIANATASIIVSIPILDCQDFRTSDCCGFSPQPQWSFLDCQRK